MHTLPDIHVTSLLVIIGIRKYFVVIVNSQVLGSFYLCHHYFYRIPEIVVIVVLARVFLNEKLNKSHIIGISLALVGLFIAVASDANIGNLTIFRQ